MGKNKKTIYTEIMYEGKKDSFYITKFIEPNCLYFANDQKQIEKNIKTFEIVPTKATEEEGGVTFSKIENNVIVTITVKTGHKEIFLQFLIKSGLTFDKLVALMQLPVNIRFFPFLDIIQQGIKLTGELKAEDLNFNKTATLKLEIKEKDAGVTVMKPKGKA